jgi:DNA helicase-2/ATP-dependent DNA helicase PcrA
VEAEKIGYPSNFTIYDTDDSKSVLRAILKEMNLDDKLYSVNFVLNRISASKNNLISGRNIKERADTGRRFFSGRASWAKFTKCMHALFPCRCYGF